MWNERARGFTLVEMIVAIGLSTLLIVLVTAIVVRGLAAFRTVTAENALRAQQQNAALWLQGIMRFIDNPVETTPSLAAIPSRTPLQVAYYRLGRFAARARELAASHDAVLAHLIRTGAAVAGLPGPKFLEQIGRAHV